MTTTLRRMFAGAWSHLRNQHIDGMELVDCLSPLNPLGVTPGEIDLEGITEKNVKNECLDCRNIR